MFSDYVFGVVDVLVAFVVFAASACDCSLFAFWFACLVACCHCSVLLCVDVICCCGLFVCLLADCSFCSCWLSIGCLVFLHLAGLLFCGSLLICLFASFLSSFLSFCLFCWL